MRILLVHSYYRLRGGEDVVFEAEAEMLESYGHEVIRFTRKNEDLIGRGSLVQVADTIWNRRVAGDIASIVKEHRIEVAHFHNTFPAISPLAIRAAYQAGAVTVKTLHNSRPLCAAGVCYRDHQPCTACIGKSFAVPAIRHACFHDSRTATGVVVLNNWIHRTNKTLQKYLDVAIAPTQYVRERYELAEYPIARIVIKPHFVERDLVPGDGRGGYALFVGRLSEEKGLRTLLDAWPLLNGRLPLKVIGTGPLENELGEAIRVSETTNGVNAVNEIQYLGQLDQTQVYAVMGDAALLILPSHCAESFGRVVVESFAKGTPVVCANQGGQAELIHVGVGATFRSGDAEDLARVVDSLIAGQQKQTSGTGCESEILGSMRAIARLEFEKYYTAAINHERLLSIYTDAINRRWPDRLVSSPLQRNLPVATSVPLLAHANVKPKTSRSIIESKNQCHPRQS